MWAFHGEKSVFEVLNINNWQVIRTACVAGLCLGLAACTQSDSPVTQTLSTQPSVTGAPEIGKINARGGTKIAILVNKTPITTNQIKRRAAFVKLRNMKGNRTSIARKELIEEAIKMQEARRINAVASDAEVNAAYIRFAKRNKMPVNVLTRVLNQRGVTQRGFKDFIRANMSWQRAVGARMRSEASGDSAVPTSPSWLPAAGGKTGREKEYTIQQIVFIVPAAKRSSVLARRRAEAKRFRTQLRGCSNAKTLAAGLRDVTVLDRGRLLESRLPPRWKKEIIATPEGKVTRTKDDPKGIEMIAVCKTREVIGTANTSEGDLFSGKNFQENATALEKKYYKELEERAVIVRR